MKKGTIITNAYKKSKPHWKEDKPTMIFTVSKVIRSKPRKKDLTLALFLPLRFPWQSASKKNGLIVKISSNNKKSKQVQNSTYILIKNDIYKENNIALERGIRKLIMKLLVDVIL